MIISSFNRIELNDKAFKRLNESTQKWLRQQYVNRFYSKMELHGFKNISDLFSYVDSEGSKYLDKDFQNIRSELSRFLKSNGAKKGRYQIFPSKKVCNYLEEKLELPVIDPKNFALEISEICYEFFFISMPTYEIFREFPDELPKGQTPDLTNLFYDINSDSKYICDSFINLKLSLSIMYAPLSMGIHFNRYGYSVNLYEGNKRDNTHNLLCKSYYLWIKSLISEGMYNNISLFDLFDFLTEDERELILKNKFHDFYPEMSRFFVILFADIALKLLSKHNYNFTNINKNSLFAGPKSNGVMKFILKDFMPQVIDYIVQNMDTCLGYSIYKQLSEIKNGATITNNKIRYNANTMLKLYNFMNTYPKQLSEWNRWYDKKQKESLSYQYFLSTTTNPNIYNNQDYVVNREDLSLKYDFSDYYL